MAEKPPTRPTTDKDKLRRREYMTLAGGAGMALAVSGCLGDDDDDPADDADDDDDDDGVDDGDDDDGVSDDWPEEYTMMSFFPGPDEPVDPEEDAPIANEEAYNWFATRFEEEHGIPFEHESLPIDDWRTLQAQVFGGDEAPHFGPTLPGQENAPALSEGVLTEVSQLVDEEIIETRDMTGWQFGDGDIMNFGTGDDYYGFPDYLSGLPLWYHGPILEDAGWDLDDVARRDDIDLDEFHQLCRDIRDATGLDVLSLGNEIGAKIPYKFSALWNKTFGFQGALDLHNLETDLRLTDPEVVDMYEIIEEWWEEDFIVADTLALSEGEADQIFFANQAGIISSGFWVLFDYFGMGDEDELAGPGEEGGFDYSWWPDRPETDVDGTEELLGFPVGGWVVPEVVENEGHEDFASTWLNEFFNDEEVLEVFGEHRGAILADERQVGGWLPVFQDMADDLAPERQAMRTDDTLVPEFGEALNSEGQRMFEGTASAAEILDDINDEWVDGMERRGASP